MQKEDTYEKKKPYKKATQESHHPKNIECRRLMTHEPLTIVILINYLFLWQVSIFISPSAKKPAIIAIFIFP
jgi:hypothetical protein